MNRFRFTLFISLILFILMAVPGHAQEQEATGLDPFLLSSQGIQTINSFTITPNTAPIGTSVTFSGEYDVAADETAFCFYFASADTSSWDNTFTALGSSADVSFTKRGSSACPAANGYGSIDFYTTDTLAAVFGDTFQQSVIVPNIASGTKIIALRQYEGTNCETGGYDTGDCAFVNFRSITNFVVQPAATTVYADPNGVCGGNSPCFDDLQAAVDAVAAGGTVNVYGTFAGGVNTGSKELALESSSTATIEGTITASAAVTVRGLNLTHTAPFAGANITAYANNLVNADDFTAGSVAFNWWGGFEPGDQPAGVSAPDWDKRLGAAVIAYGVGSLGNASVTGGTGTAVIVSHGRGHENAPFGQATVEDGNTQCSDYYDVFVQAGSGTWQVSIPIDMGTGCDSVYQARLIAMLNMAPECTDGSPPGGCWDSALDYGTSITQVSDSNSRRLRVNGLPTLALQGTPFVSGNQDDLGPTTVALIGLGTGQSTLSPIYAIAALLFVISLLALAVVRRRPHPSA